jgi:crotonobetainyl-CoA:carnitine CoA-transferase CaiB-like acyl-CoA transferase
VLAAACFAQNGRLGKAVQLNPPRIKLRRFRPDLIMISMSGYGQTGPFKGFIGYGPPASAAAGMFFATGYRGMGPSEIGISGMPGSVRSAAPIRGADTEEVMKPRPSLSIFL